MRNRPVDGDNCRIQCKLAGFLRRYLAGSRISLAEPRSGVTASTLVACG
jgi:hypothetical protein